MDAETHKLVVTSVITGIVGLVGGLVLASLLGISKTAASWMANRPLRRFAKAELKKHHEAMDRVTKNPDSPNHFTNQTEAMTSLRAAVSAFRKAGDKVEALKLEKTLQGWERLQQAQDAGLDPGADALGRALLQVAKGLEQDYKIVLERAGALPPDAFDTRIELLSQAVTASKGAADRYRAGKDVEKALKLEQLSREAEDNLMAAQAAREKAIQRNPETTARLLTQAQEQEKLYKIFRDNIRKQGGVNTKNRTMWVQKSASAAKSAADHYREAGDPVNALKWDQVARDTVP